MIVFECEKTGLLTRKLSSKEAQIVLANLKKDDTGYPVEGLYAATVRCERQGKLPRMIVRDLPKRIVSAAGIKAALKKRSMRCADGAVQEIEKAVNVVLDLAIQIARNDMRKTIKAGDINGSNGLSLAPAKRGLRRAK